MNSHPETEGHTTATPNSTVPVRNQPTMFGRLGRLCLKELREILRDRRTIITLVFMPLLVYTLLYMIFENVLKKTVQSADDIQYVFGVESEEARAKVGEYLAGGEEILRRQGEMPDLNMRIFEVKNLRASVAAGDIDVGIVILPPDNDKPTRQGRSDLVPGLNCELIYREESQLSQTGIRHIERRLQAINDQYVREVLAIPLVERSLPRFGFQAALPTKVSRTTVGAIGSQFPLTTFVPLMLIFMTITGAVYPAIDLTAGERERGTLEMLMAAPVPRLGLLLAKYVAVLTVALFTATANLVAMTVTLMATPAGPMLFGDEGLSPLLVSQVFALLILFAAFFSAVLLALTSFARSFKEAQAYLVPVMLLSLAPGIMSLMPEIQFNGVLAITPLVNVVLLARSVFESNVDPMLASVAVVSTILYAIAALALAARVFGSDAILYGSQGTWSDLWRKPSQPRSNATIAGAMSCLALLFPANFLVSNSLRSFAEESMTLWLVLATVALIVLFIGAPLLFAWLQKVRIRSGFRLSTAVLLAFVGAIFLGLSIWPFSHEIVLIQKFLGITALSEVQIKGAQEIIERLRQVPLVVILLTLAVTPAVCEEFFFRGYLFGTLRQTMRPWKTIVVSALLFGAFHVVTTTSLSVERFVPSTLMGLVLGWICWRSGSVFPGMVLHACHNGFLLTVLYFQEELAANGWGIQEEAHMPPTWLATAAVVVVVGVALVWVVTKKKEEALTSELGENH